MEVFFEVGKRDEMTTDALTMLLYSSLGHFTPMSCSQTRKVRRERETLGLDSIERSVKSFTLELFASEAMRAIFKFFVYISKRDNSKVGKKNVCLAWRNYEFVSVSLLLASLARRFIQIKTSEKKALMSWRGFV